MIRGVTCVSIAVRRPNGEIAVWRDPLRWGWATRLRRVPFLRGVIVLAEMLVVGTRALMFSAEAAVEKDSGEKEELPAVALWGTLAFSLLFAVGLFFVLPVLVTGLFDRAIDDPFLSNVVEGVVRLAIFLGYIAAVSLLPDIRRVFAYHGAEHMTVHAYEHAEPLETEKIRRYPTAHPRCGTAFLLVVFVVAVLLHVLLGTPPLLERVLSRVALLPVIAGVSYEIIRWSGAHAGNPLVRLVILPNLALQALTTRQPDDRQIEVAVKAMEGAIEGDRLARAGG
ncbi:MAG: DUF1385 domain-containing protein [Chloroflexi bacterium]|nr:DUF1385 domain-containing protein [Chloroflexota bacterium]